MPRIQCPHCGEEGCYNNGVTYQCPDCDYEWEFGTDEDGFEIIVWDNIDGQLYGSDDDDDNDYDDDN